jgi:hypothetical protein
MSRNAALGLLAAFAVGLTLGLTLARPGRVANADDHPQSARDRTGHPMADAHLYLCAFHIAKKDPKFQVEAHHYCSEVRPGVHQCLIFDNRGQGARVLGVEYIINDAIYRRLPDSEKKYYHPHTYEILSGQLVAPTLAADTEDKLMEGLITTWGKTWHTWPDPAEALPLGDPLLMWSIGGDGQLDPKLIEARDRKLGIATEEVRKRRARVLGLPVPQIAPPKSIEDLGRQFTNQGPDQPQTRSR